ncbi:MAG: DUF5118 domain-containing protein, partial [Planctomycetales bacterium]
MQRNLQIPLLAAWLGLILAGFWLPTSPLQAQTKAKKKPYAEVIKDAKTITGVVKLHHLKSKLYLELKTTQLNQDFLVLTTIARGIAERGLLGGMTWDDWLWQFRKVDDRIHIVSRNTHYTAKAGSPEASAVKFAYTDSILFSLPIITNGPGGSMLIDVTSVFMSDVAQISQSLPGFTFSATKSH